MKWLQQSEEPPQSLGELFDKYPNKPGYKREGTSKETAKEVEIESTALRLSCLKAIQEYPRTSDEVAFALGRSVLAIRPRISELVAKGKIIDSGNRRRNTSGKMAAIWRAV